MNVKCLLAMILASCLSLHTPTFAQIPSGRNPSDHPSHRYLPPPVGKGSLSEQIHSLEQLNQSSDDANVAPLQLSPAQLKQLDSILESFRDENGQLNIPSPDTVPKQWIDNLLPDPKQRQQAKEMLEQYSRSRNVPLNRSNSPDALPPIDSPESNASSPSSGERNLDMDRPADKQRSDNPSSSSQRSANPRTDNPRTDNPRNQRLGTPGNDGQSTAAKPRAGRNQPTDSTSDSTAASDSSVLSQDSSPDPFGAPRSNTRGRGETDARPSDTSPNQTNSSTQLRNRRDDAANSDSESSTAPNGDTFELPKDTPPALRELYEALKHIQQQNERAQRETTSSRVERQLAQPNRNRDATNPRNPQRNSNQQSRLVNPNDPRNSGRTSGANSAPPNRSRSNTPLTSPSRMRSQPQVTDNDLANGIGSSGLNAPSSPSGTRASDGSSSPANSGAPSQVAQGDQLPRAGEPSRDTERNPKALTPFDEGFDFSADQNVAVDPFADTEDPTKDINTRGASRRTITPPKPPEPFKVTRMAQQPQSGPGSNNSAPNSNSNNSDPGNKNLDWKKSVNELGLGPALKKIVQDTLKQQGYDSTQPAGSASSSKTASSGSGGAGSNTLTPPNLPSRMPSQQTTEQLKKWVNSVAASPSNSSNNSTSNSNSNWGKWAGDAWKAVAESPRSSRGSSASSTTAFSPPAAASQLPGFQWTNSMTMALLVVAALVLMIVWFSRQPAAQLSDAAASQAEWVRTVMAQGLKTRADVVRAFHQLVKQSRAVSDWWTHRSIVKYFSTQTPQLATAISELAVVYEQARYYPDDVELSPQQLAQVRTLLESVKIPSKPVSG